MDIQGVARVAANTTLAACSGGLGALFFVYPRSGAKWDCGATVNGLLGWLGCHHLSLLLGVTAGSDPARRSSRSRCHSRNDLLEYLRIDDLAERGQFTAPAASGGTWSLGLFATGQARAPNSTGCDHSAGAVVKGLFYGGGWNQFIAQVEGNAAIGIGVFVAAMVLMYAVKATGTLRISKEGELEGLDLHEHGGTAYPDTKTSSH